MCRGGHWTCIDAACEQAQTCEQRLCGDLVCMEQVSGVLQVVSQYDSGTLHGGFARCVRAASITVFAKGVSISVRMTIVTHDRCLSILEVEFVVWFGDDNMSAPLAFPPLYLWLIFP